MLTLETPLSDINALRALADGRSRTVKLERDKLSRLLIDHARMAAALWGEIKEQNE